MDTASCAVCETDHLAIEMYLVFPPMSLSNQTKWMKSRYNKPLRDTEHVCAECWPDYTIDLRDPQLSVLDP